MQVALAVIIQKGVSVVTGHKQSFLRSSQAREVPKHLHLALLAGSKPEAPKNWSQNRHLVVAPVMSTLVELHVQERAVLFQKNDVIQLQDIPWIDVPLEF